MQKLCKCIGILPLSFLLHSTYVYTCASTMQTIILVGTCKCSFIEQFYTMICTCIVKCLLYLFEDFNAYAHKYLSWIEHLNIRTYLCLDLRKEVFHTHLTHKLPQFIT